MLTVVGGALVQDGAAVRLAERVDGRVAVCTGQEDAGGTAGFSGRRCDWGHAGVGGGAAVGRDGVGSLHCETRWGWVLRRDDAVGGDGVWCQGEAYAGAVYHHPWARGRLHRLLCLWLRESKCSLADKGEGARRGKLPQVLACSHDAFGPSRQLGKLWTAVVMAKHRAEEKARIYLSG